jgi:hypothetical protein
MATIYYHQNIFDFIQSIKENILGPYKELKKELEMISLMLYSKTSLFFHSKTIRR